jgi:hypothetical protein
MHAFCVGLGKSGTHSIAGMFRSSYRAAHEPETDELIEIILAELEGRMTTPAIAARLRRRDKRLWLEMDSSGLNGIMVGHLAALFPDAKFILTIRDCYTWLDSVINHYRTREGSEVWKRFWRAWHQESEHVYSSAEAVLQDSGLYPLGSYLKQWTIHNYGVLRAVPADRLLVIRTDRINDSAARLAEFLSIPLDTINVSQSHLFRRQMEIDILRRIDPEFVEEQVAQHCRELMATYFPDIPDRQARHRADRAN